MNKVLLFRLLAAVWSATSLATAEDSASGLLQELAFLALGQRVERARLGKTSEVAFELLDLLAD